MQNSRWKNTDSKRAKSKLDKQNERDKAGKSSDTVSCHKCNCTNQAHSKFCEECGAPLADVTSCPRCEAMIEVGAVACDRCGAWVAASRCRHCGGEIALGEKFCSNCGREPIPGECPGCGRSAVSDFCPHCSMPLTQSAKATIARSGFQKEKDAFSRLANDLQTLRLNPGQDDGQRDAEAKLEREQMLALNQVLKAAKAECSSPTEKSKHKTSTPLFSKAESELMQKKAELRRMMEEQGRKTFKTPQEAREYFHAVRPPNTLGWVCNYKNTIHPSPDGCAHPEHGGHWEMFNDIRWVSTTEDV